MVYFVCLLNQGFPLCNVCSDKYKMPDTWFVASLQGNNAAGWQMIGTEPVKQLPVQHLLIQH